jgi:hypothetical protein
VTDKGAGVLRRDGTPVEKIYACGNDMRSIMGGNYPGPGITTGPEFVFAYLTARYHPLVTPGGYTKTRRGVDTVLMRSRRLQ